MKNLIAETKNTIVAVTILGAGITFFQVLHIVMG